MNCTKKHEFILLRNRALQNSYKLNSLTEIFKNVKCGLVIKLKGWQSLAHNIFKRSENKKIHRYNWLVAGGVFRELSLIQFPGINQFVEASIPK